MRQLHKTGYFNLTAAAEAFLAKVREAETANRELSAQDERESLRKRLNTESRPHALSGREVNVLIDIFHMHETALAGAGLYGKLPK